ncbi:MAG TPA: aquaporin [Sporichthyaceae bacterium]|jgi:glycerol uptake facilitator protein/aquaporin Z|nr:aquaporin [Sporichthyaceae bacterium]
MSLSGVPPTAGRPAGAPSGAPRPGLRDLARGSALEFLLTGVLLFGVVTIVRWVAGPSSLSAVLPGIHPRLVVIGACVGLLLVGLMRSPAGKASGGHMNPAISVAMWRFGALPGAAVGPYVAAQLAGSLVGALAGRAVWGPVVGRPPVEWASLAPAPGWSDGALFAGEAIPTGVIVLFVGLFLAAPRLAALVPWLVAALVATAIAALGTTTGGSVNPARQFGPAVAAGRTAHLWVYLVAPVVGALLAARLRATLVNLGTGRVHRSPVNASDGTSVPASVDPRGAGRPVQA